MTYRVATVSFLNSWPLVELFRSRENTPVSLVADLPSQLPELLFSGQADVALIPAVEYFRGCGRAIAPGVGICTVGQVDSVKLFSRVKPTQIRHVAVDRGSRTSVALLRILFAELYNVQPDFKVAKPHPETLLDNEDAALVIGDRCFEAEGHFNRASLDDLHIIDLGEVWRQMTGLPFVFAVWVFSDEFADRAGARGMTDLSLLLKQSLDFGMAHLEELADRAVAKGCSGPGGQTSREAILHYFRTSLCFEMGAAELAGLTRFRDLCVKHHLINTSRPIEVATLSP